MEKKNIQTTKKKRGWKEHGWPRPFAKKNVKAERGGANRHGCSSTKKKKTRSIGGEGTRSKQVRGKSRMFSENGVAPTPKASLDGRT